MADPRDNLTDARALLPARPGRPRHNRCQRRALCLAGPGGARTRRGKPLLLLSDLAEHSKNLRRDGRASLLFDGTAGLASR